MHPGQLPPHPGTHAGATYVEREQGVASAGGLVQRVRGSPPAAETWRGNPGSGTWWKQGVTANGGEREGTGRGRKALVQGMVDVGLALAHRSKQRGETERKNDVT